MTIAFIVPRVPPGTLLFVSACQLLGMYICIDWDWGDVVAKRRLVLRALFATTTTLAAAAVYVVATTLPVRPWGLAAIVWACLNLTWMIWLLTVEHDYTLFLSAWVTLGMLFTAIADSAGARPTIIFAITVVFLGSTLALVPFRTRVFKLGSRLAWRLFLWHPDSDTPGAEAFFRKTIADSSGPSPTIRHAVATFGLARCRWHAGDHEQAFRLAEDAIETLGGPIAPGWRCVIHTQAATWEVHLAMLAAAKDSATSALDLSVSLTRVRALKARAHLVRATALFGLEEFRESKRDVDQARQLLRRRRNPQLWSFALNLESSLAARSE